MIWAARLGLFFAFFFFQESDPNVQCDNGHDTAPAHKCACEQTKCHKQGEYVPEDKKCKAYCHKDHCHCVSECAT